MNADKYNKMKNELNTKLHNMFDKVWEKPKYIISNKCIIVSLFFNKEVTSCKSLPIVFKLYYDKKSYFINLNDTIIQAYSVDELISKLSIEITQLIVFKVTQNLDEIHLDVEEVLSQFIKNY